MPAECDPEDIHKEKDRWTFIVFILAVNRYLLSCGLKPLEVDAAVRSSQFVEWLCSSSQAVQILCEFDSKADNTHTGRLIENILSGVVQVPNGLMVGSDNDNPGLGEGNREVGVSTNIYRERALVFFRELVSEESQSGFLFLETPKAFIDYCREFEGEIDWKKLQKAVTKLRCHVPGEDSLFHRRAGKSCMQFDTVKIWELLTKEEAA